jgi:hypothetical protein
LGSTEISRHEDYCNGLDWQLRRYMQESHVITMEAEIGRKIFMQQEWGVMCGWWDTLFQGAAVTRGLANDTTNPLLDSMRLGTPDQWRGGQPQGPRRGGVLSGALYPAVELPARLIRQITELLSCNGWLGWNAPWRLSCVTPGGICIWKMQFGELLGWLWSLPDARKKIRRLCGMWRHEFLRELVSMEWAFYRWSQWPCHMALGLGAAATETRAVEWRPAARPGEAAGTRGLGLKWRGMGGDLVCHIYTFLAFEGRAMRGMGHLLALAPK